jgi:thiamine monophosphate kinase
MAAASGVRLAVDMTAVPAAAGAAAVAAAAGEEPEEFVAAAGEDYELLAAVPAPGVEAALGALNKSGLDPAVIGRAETGEGLVLRGATGRELNARGYDQLRSRAPAEPS